MKLTYAIPVLGALALMAALPDAAQARSHNSFDLSIGFGYSNYGGYGGYNPGAAFRYSNGGGYYGRPYRSYYAPRYSYAPRYYAPRYYAPAPVYRDAYYYAPPAPRYYYNDASYDYGNTSYYRPAYYAPRHYAPRYYSNYYCD